MEGTCDQSMKEVVAGHGKGIAISCSNRSDNGDDHFCSNLSWSSLEKSCK